MSVVTVGDAEQLSTLEVLILGKVSKEVSQTEMTRSSRADWPIKTKNLWILNSNMKMLIS